LKITISQSVFVKSTRKTSNRYQLCLLRATACNYSRCLSVWSSVTLLICIKTVQARITKFLL